MNTSLGFELKRAQNDLALAKVRQELQSDYVEYLSQELKKSASTPKVINNVEAAVTESDEVTDAKPKVKAKGVSKKTARQVIEELAETEGEIEPDEELDSMLNAEATDDAPAIIKADDLRKVIQTIVANKKIKDGTKQIAEILKKFSPTGEAKVNDLDSKDFAKVLNALKKVA